MTLDPTDLPSDAGDFDEDDAFPEECPACDVECETLCAFCDLCVACCRCLEPTDQKEQH